VDVILSRSESAGLFYFIEVFETLLFDNDFPHQSSERNESNTFVVMLF
jgi:hypothetical protein